MMNILIMVEEENTLAELTQKVDEILHTDSKSALKLSFNLLQKAEEYEHNPSIGLAHNKIAYCYYNLRQLDNSLNHFVKSKEIFIEIGNNKAVIDCLNSLGVIHRQNGNYSKALKLYYESLKISENAGFSNPVIYNNIATIYFKQNDFKKALTYYSKSLKIKESNNDSSPNSIIPVLSNIANIHYELKDYEEAKRIHSRVIKLGRSANQPILFIPALKGLSKIYLKEGKTEKAYELLNEGISLCEKTNFHIEVIWLSLELSNVLKDLGRYEERKALLKESLSIAIDHQNDLIYHCLNKLLEHYEDVNDFENAFEVLKQINVLREQKIKTEKDQKLAELQTQFETREKDNLLTQSKEFSKELENQNAKLQALNQELQQFNYAVSHDLKEPIRSVKAYSKLLLTHAESKMNEEELEAVTKLEESIKRMEQMIDDLLQFAILGNKEKSMVDVDLNEVLAIVKADLQIQIKENQANITSDQLPTIKAHKSLMVQLFQNLISNAIKFRKPSEAPKVIISSVTQRKFHLLQISDNGIGIPIKQQENVFKLFKRLDKTSDRSGSGIGLSLCQKIITKMQGHISLASNNLGGTTFTVELPNTAT